MSELSISLIKSMIEHQRKKLWADELLTIACDNDKCKLYSTRNESVKSLNDTTITFREEVSNNNTQIIMLNSKRPTRGFGGMRDGPWTIVNLSEHSMQMETRVSGQLSLTDRNQAITA